MLTLACARAASHPGVPRGDITTVFAAIFLTLAVAGFGKAE
jgi:hypothetical protein